MTHEWECSRTSFGSQTRCPAEPPNLPASERAGPPTERAARRRSGTDPVPAERPSGGVAKWHYSIATQLRRSLIPLILRRVARTEC